MTSQVTSESGGPKDPHQQVLQTYWGYFGGDFARTLHWRLQFEIELMRRRKEMRYLWLLDGSSWQILTWTGPCEIERRGPSGDRGGGMFSHTQSMETLKEKRNKLKM